jgi:hypothetical protein
MALADIFNFSSLVILGILLLVVCLLVLYFENKMREQNHKIASMLSLVSSLAEEVNGVKFGINHLVMRGGVNVDGQNFDNIYAGENNVNNTKLVIVSDDEEDDEEGDEVTIEEEELESILDEDTSVLEESDNDAEEDNEDNEEDNLEDIKVLKLNIGNQINEIDLNSVSEEDLEEDLEDDLEEDDLESIGSSKSTVVTMEPLNNTPTKSQMQEDYAEQLEISSFELKTININLDEHIDPIDYKKLSLQKLKSVVVEKGLVSDASKLKKNDLLKLLGVE